MRQIRLHCPVEGSLPMKQFCLQQYPNGYASAAPVNQGIFVYDLQTGTTRCAAKLGEDFFDFLFWNCSGHVPGSTIDGVYGGFGQRRGVADFVESEAR
jgi:hypothetical protein